MVRQLCPHCGRPSGDAIRPKAAGTKGKPNQPPWNHQAWRQKMNPEYDYKSWENRLSTFHNWWGRKFEQQLEQIFKMEGKLLQTRIPHLAQTSDKVNRQLSCFSSRYMNLLAVFQI